MPNLPIGVEEIHQDSSRPVLPRQLAVGPRPLDLGNLSAFVDLGHGPLGQLDRLCLALVDGVVRQSSDDLWPGPAQCLVEVAERLRQVLELVFTLHKGGATCALRGDQRRLRERLRLPWPSDLWRCRLQHDVDRLGGGID